MKLNIEKTFPSSKNYKYYSNYIKYRMTICDLAVKEKLRELLLSSEDSIPIDEALVRRFEASWNYPGDHCSCGSLLTRLFLQEIR